MQAMQGLRLFASKLSPSVFQEVGRQPEATLQPTLPVEVVDVPSPPEAAQVPKFAEEEVIEVPSQPEAAEKSKLSAEEAQPEPAPEPTLAAEEEEVLEVPLQVEEPALVIEEDYEVEEASVTEEVSDAWPPLKATLELALAEEEAEAHLQPEAGPQTEAHEEQVQPEAALDWGLSAEEASEAQPQPEAGEAQLQPEAAFEPRLPAEEASEVRPQPEAALEPRLSAEDASEAASEPAFASEEVCEVLPEAQERAPAAEEVCKTLRQQEAAQDQAPAAEEVCETRSQPESTQDPPPAAEQVCETSQQPEAASQPESTQDPAPAAEQVCETSQQPETAQESASEEDCEAWQQLEALQDAELTAEDASEATEDPVLAAEEPCEAQPQPAAVAEGDSTSAEQVEACVPGLKQEVAIEDCHDSTVSAAILPKSCKGLPKVEVEGAAELPTEEEGSTGQQARTKRLSILRVASPGAPGASKKPRYEGRAFGELTVSELEQIVREVADLKKQLAARESHVVKGLQASVAANEKEISKLQAAVREHEKDVDWQAQRVKKVLLRQIMAQMLYVPAWRGQLQHGFGRSITAYAANVGVQILRALGAEAAEGGKELGKYSDWFFGKKPQKGVPGGLVLVFQRKFTFKYVKGSCELRLHGRYKVEGASSPKTPARGAAPGTPARGAAPGTPAREPAKKKRRRRKRESAEDAEGTEVFEGAEGTGNEVHDDEESAAGFSDVVEEVDGSEP